MAGSYPDYPDHRMAYDRDGTTLVRVNDGSSPVEASAAVAQGFNSETGDSTFADEGGDVDYSIGLIFPELRDVTAYMFCFAAINTAQSVHQFQSSTDTTNLADGTWTTREDPFTPVIGPVIPGHRTAIHTLAAPLTGVKAIRWRLWRVMGGDNVAASKLHVYGKPSAGQNPDRLRFWHPTLDQEETGAYFDWGNTPRGAQLFRSFRVKNNSPTLTAHSVTVAMETLSDTTPSLLTQHRLSTDGATWAASVNLGDLAPGALSAVVTMRNTVDAAAPFGLGTLRRIADAASWS